MWRPSALEQARTASISGCILTALPCEKFIRKQSAPARISARMVPSEDEAGPNVAMIFVCFRRGMACAATAKGWLDHSAASRGTDELSSVSLRSGHALGRIRYSYRAWTS